MNPVDFFVIGAMKCGSSTVCGSFAQHPEVHMPRGAERDFFSNDDVYARGVDAYHETLAGRGEEPVMGEGSNNYAYVLRYPKSPARMAEYNPSAKIIFMVRNPVDRVLSHWTQSMVQGDERDIIDPDEIADHPSSSYVERSRYWTTVEAYLAHFPAEQIFLGFVEEMEAEPNAFYSRACQFIGVNADAPLSRETENRSVGKTMPSALQRTLRKSPISRKVAQYAPAGAKAFLRQKVLTTKLKKKFEFSPESRSRVADLLRDDAAQLLEWAGKPSDLWRL